MIGDHFHLQSPALFIETAGQPCEADVLLAATRRLFCGPNRNLGCLSEALLHLYRAVWSENYRENVGLALYMRTTPSSGSLLDMRVSRGSGHTG